jgi:trimethylamine--corrinoid protein Co-methyltransferase
VSREGAAGTAGERPAPARQPLAPLRADLRLQACDERRLAPIVEATFDVLARTGVKCRSQKGLAVFSRGGATVDEASGLVLLPRPLVEEALALAPRTFVLGSRDGETDLDLASGETYGTTDGCGTEVVDWRTGERRPSTKADLADVTRMQDCLGSIAFWWPTVGAGDCGETAQLHELEAGWTNTSKHLMGMVQGEALANYAVEMAAVAAEARSEGPQPPVLSDLIGTVSPLVLDEDGVGAGLVFAQAGIPVCYVTMPTLGTTAPASQAGALVVGAAEIVAAAVLHQLAVPGAPVWGSIMSTYADPRTALTMTAPRDDRGRFMSSEVLHAFGLPALGAFGGTDATEPGSWQAGIEQAVQLLQLPLDGCETYTGIGLHGTYQVFAPEDLVLDDDLYHRARCAYLDLALDDDALALETIAAVGPGGNYLGQPHTRRRMREVVVRALTQQIGADGRHYRDAFEVARERARDILERYEPPPLGETERRELRRIVDAADESLRG